jgi:hypothetical protein
MAGLLIAAAITFLFIMSRHMPEPDRAQATARTFVTAMQHNDASLAYDMGSDTFRTATTEQHLNELFRQTRPFLADAAVDRIDNYYASNDKGDARDIVVYAVTKDSKVTYIRLVLEKQAGTWKVHSLLTKGTPLQAKPE